MNPCLPACEASAVLQLQWLLSRRIGQQGRLSLCPAPSPWSGAWQHPEPFMYCATPAACEYKICARLQAFRTACLQPTAGSLIRPSSWECAGKEAAAGIALVNSLGALGGAIGPVLIGVLHGSGESGQGIRVRMLCLSCVWTKQL